MFSTIRNISCSTLVAGDDFDHAPLFVSGVGGEVAQHVQHHAPVQHRAGGVAYCLQVFYFPSVNRTSGSVRELENRATLFVPGTPMLQGGLDGPILERTIKP